MTQHATVTDCVTYRAGDGAPLVIPEGPVEVDLAPDSATLLPKLSVEPVLEAELDGRQRRSRPHGHAAHAVQRLRARQKDHAGEIAR